MTRTTGTGSPVLTPLPEPPPARKSPPHTPLPGAALIGGGLAAAGTALLTGVLAAGALRDFLDRMAGVIALVALSAAVMLGLATALRGLLPPPVRSHAQRLHRVAGAVGVGALLTHIGVKVAGGRVDAATAVLGWGSGDALVGLGTLACHLFLLALATGIWRGIFASRHWVRPFRILHGASYAAWAAAMIHGLTAGRPPAPWVIAAYTTSAAAVTATLILRRARSRT
ncbi:hypothetical protein [Streptomyces sp. SID12501]|uniref:Ferric reductase n=1 Tax=Streptomyces sp. SID12501 TaxID=2706042 RepID=A0A6B3C7K4_9ACTN|nr:hypothetical protein [Streptomyces sp. SID12501]NEC92579.1 hypothetical protein [Streptomyces sp. SID12501]